MAGALNRVELIGYVGKDPKVKDLPGGSSVATLSVATTETWKDKKGEKQTKTEWHQIAAYGKLADIVDQYVKKGMQVFVEGKIETKEWADKKTGEEKKSVGIIASRVLMLGKKEGDGKERDNGFSSNDDDYDGDPWS